MTQLQLWRIHILFYLCQISIWLISYQKVVHFLPLRMLILQNDIGILQLTYINWSTDFRGLPFNEEMVSSYLKHKNSFLKSEFMWRQIHLAACCRDSAWADVRSSVKVYINDNFRSISFDSCFFCVRPFSLDLLMLVFLIKVHYEWKRYQCISWEDTKDNVIVVSVAIRWADYHLRKSQTPKEIIYDQICIKLGHFTRN